jgi:hypothetical protein
MKGMCVAGGEDDADGGYYILRLLAALSHLFHRQNMDNETDKFTWILYYSSVCSHANINSHLWPSCGLFLTCRGENIP